MSLLILVVDDEPDVEILFRQQFRRDLRGGRFSMEFAQSADMALLLISNGGDQSLILIDVKGGFRSSGLHRATSSASSLADRTGASLFVTPATAASIAERVVSSVQHHNAALPRSG